MTSDMIEKFVENGSRKNAVVNIHFKERSTVTGVFVKGADYDELKHKNFWRIVSKTNITQWEQTKDMSLPRIYNGLSFTRLSDSDDK